MATQPPNDDAATPRSKTKKCFVISEFGADEKTRIERTQMLKHLVKKVCEPMGYIVQRADDIDDLGPITHSIIERLLDDDLVVADLTGLNPNVFYELAVRHAARKPVITLMTAGESIPFDVKDVRTVFYDLHDPDKLEAAQFDLAQKVRAVEKQPTDVRNPISVARNVTLLRQSDDPEAQAAGDVLAAINDLRDELRGLKQPVRSERRTASRSGRAIDTAVQDLFIPFEADEVIIRTAADVAREVDIPENVARMLLNKFADDVHDPIVRTSDDAYARSPPHARG